jgi:hypothetical protein
MNCSSIGVQLSDNYDFFDKKETFISPWQRTGIQLVKSSGGAAM